MQITRVAAALAALALGATGCRNREPPPPRGAPRAAILQDVPAVAFSELRDTTGTSDAERRTYVARIPLDSTAVFYRTWLPQHGWALLNDRTDRPAGRIDLYARKGPQTLWVHIEKQSEGTTEYTLLASGVEDSLSRRAARPPGDSTP